MNSPDRYVPFTINRTTQPVMNGCGGRNIRLIRSRWPNACGEKAPNRALPGKDPSAVDVK